MWARIIELMLACWLALSPFVFRHGRDDTRLWLTDFVAASTVALLSLLSFRPALQRAHLLNILVALCLIASGALPAGSHSPAGYQNHVVLGLLLLMFAVVPSRSGDPPAAWQAFYQRAGHERQSRTN